MAELTDEEIAREKEFLAGVPRLNVAALFLPPVWGPAHGMWATILFYPIWLFADNAFYAAYSQRTALSIVVALVVFVTLSAGTVVFAVLSQPFAAHRAIDRGLTKEQYLKHERIWALACVVVGLLMLAAATYYNLALRAGAGQ